MKNLRLLFMIFAVLSLQYYNSFSQDDKVNNLDFEDVKPKEESYKYFGVGGGFTASFLYPDFSALNDQLQASNFGVDKLSGGVFLGGGEGFVAIPIIPNLRAGIFGMAGSKTIDKTIENINSSGHNVTRSIQYGVGLTGIMLGYGIKPFNSLSLVVLPGVNAGFGRLTIDMYQGDSVDWGGIKPGQYNEYNWFNRAETSLWYVQPNVSFEFAFTMFTMIRANVGYNLQLSGDSSWKLNNNADLKNISNVNIKGLSFQIGLYLGLFNY
jgi:hypothetical protein